MRVLVSLFCASEVASEGGVYVAGGGAVGAAVVVPTEVPFETAVAMPEQEMQKQWSQRATSSSCAQRELHVRLSWLLLLKL